MNAVRGMPLAGLFLLPQSMVYHDAMGKLILAILLMFLTPLLAEAGATREQLDKDAPAVVRKSPAELRADQLDGLFAKLHTVASPDEAQGAELKIWQLWMRSDSPTAEVLLRQATLAMNDGANAAALSILDQLVETHADFAEAWNKRATLYFNMGRYDESLADIDKVLELEPRHFGALSGRGMILARQKKYPEALAAYREAIEMNPTMESVKSAIKALEKFETPI